MKFLDFSVREIILHIPSLKLFQDQGGNKVYLFRMQSHFLKSNLIFSGNVSFDIIVIKTQHPNILLSPNVKQLFLQRLSTNLITKSYIVQSNLYFTSYESCYNGRHNMANPLFCMYFTTYLRCGIPIINYTFRMNDYN